MVAQTTVRQLWVGWGNAAVYEINAGAPYTLPLVANPAFGQIEMVKDVGFSSTTNPITVSGNGHTIDNSTTYLINTNGACAIFYWDGSQWLVIGTANQGGGAGLTNQMFVMAGTTGIVTSLGTFVGFQSATTGAKTLTIPTSTGSLGEITVGDMQNTAGTYNITVNPATGSILGPNSIYTNLGSITLLDTNQGWFSI